MNNLPIDNEDGLIVTVSVMRKGTGEEIKHFMEDKHLQSVGELKNIVIKAAEMLNESRDVTKI